MDKIDRIVVGNEELASLGVALEKAATIEHYTGAEITVAEVVYDHIADEPEDALSSEDKARLIEALKAAERQGLSRVVAPFEDHVATLTSRIVWHKNKAEGILSVVDEVGADLLIKPVSQHHAIGDVLHAPTDWALMRQASCPVLVSKKPWGDDKCVLAAVDAGDAFHDDLNVEVLTAARGMSRVLNAPLHVVAVHPDFGQRVDDYQVAMDFAGIKADMAAHREEKLKKYDEDLELNSTRHVLAGDPGAVITALARQLDATVTVIGTQARRGLAKFFIGNTAEDVIRRLDGDVVSIRTADP